MGTLKKDMDTNPELAQSVRRHPSYKSVQEGAPSGWEKDPLLQGPKKLTPAPKLASKATAVRHLRRVK